MDFQKNYLGNLITQRSKARQTLQKILNSNYILGFLFSNSIETIGLSKNQFQTLAIIILLQKF